MKKKNFISMIFLGLVIGLQAQDDNFGYQNWPGKDGSIKQKIEFNVAPFLEFGLLLKSPDLARDTILCFVLPISKKDIDYKGQFCTRIYPTIEKAQYALLDFLFAIQSNIKPPRLTKEEFSFGDVAFGWTKEGVFRVYFCSHNVMTIIEAPEDTTKRLAAIMDSIIQKAPNWSQGDPKPCFIILEEFIHFFVKTP